MSYLSEKDIALLEAHACAIRKTVVTMLAQAKSGHTAGALGMADVFAALYFYILEHKPEEPEWEERDRLVLSNGHIVPVRYAAMAECGYFPYEEIHTLRTLGSRLQGHPERTRLLGLETTSGPLGEGLSQAIGIALGARMDKKDFHTYVVMSDGEHQCGIVWEAVMFAGKEKLSNLTVIIDRNFIQISGNTEEVMPLEPLHAKYEAFGWNTIQINGNDVEMVCDAVERAKLVTDKPTVIIADVIAGKGIEAIEGEYEWHGKVPTEAEAKLWIAELEKKCSLSSIV
jgi:transketolase